MTGQIFFRDFESQILYFNGMYKLPVAPYPCTFKVVESIGGELSAKQKMIKRLSDFKNIIKEEADEIDDIIGKIHSSSPVQLSGKPALLYDELDFLTDLADLLGDIQVYCASEMAKFGIPHKETLTIIMQSNFSKLGADGKPIYDERGKVQKGPGYWKPEPQIKEMLAERLPLYKVGAPIFDKDIVWRKEE